MFLGRSLKYVIILQEVKSGNRVEVLNKLQKSLVECYEQSEKSGLAFSPFWRVSDAPIGHLRHCDRTL